MSSSSTEQRPTIRLVMVAGQRLDMLWHTISHYKNLGISEFCIILHGETEKDPLIDRGKAILASLGLSPYQIVVGTWAERFNQHHISEVFRAFPDSWFLIADQDELQIYPNELHEIASWCERKGYDAVSGLHVDRHASEGVLADAKEHQSIWEQFPIASTFASVIAGADPKKIVLCRSGISLDPGQHGFQINAASVCPSSKLLAQVHHFKWTANVITNLKSRVALFEGDLKHTNSFWLLSETRSFLRYFADSGAIVDLSDPAIFVASSPTARYSGYSLWPLLVHRIYGDRRSVWQRAVYWCTRLTLCLMSDKLLCGISSILLDQLKIRTSISEHGYQVFKNQLHCLRYKKLSMTNHPECVSLGSGDGYLGRAWLGLDVYAQCPGIKRYDCRKNLPFADSTLRVIFAEHFIEHLNPFEELSELLADCYRCLKSGGVLRVVIPDAEAYLRAYGADSWDDLAVLRQLSEDKEDPFTGSVYTTKMELVNEVFHQSGEHKLGLDFETISLYLKRAGFNMIQRSKFGQSLIKDWNQISIERAERASESLYVEAQKLV
jgi:predicted SAM-dependent methyltransferase